MAREIVARSPAAAGLLSAEQVQQRSPHLGLVFDRFPRLLGQIGGHYSLPTGARFDWLKEFIALAAPTKDRRERLRAVNARLDALARDGLRREMQTVWRFVSGLGNPSASDTGMAFDTACGVPYLPGSSVKGIARAGAVLAEAAEEDKAGLLGRPLDTDDKGESGTIVFFDALPLYWPTFEIDIITRHHDPEALPTQSLPLETDQPNPVHFLTVAPNQVFVFRLLATREARDGALDKAWGWLSLALNALGAGAKTAVGYGQLVERSDKRSKRSAGPRSD